MATGLLEKRVDSCSLAVRVDSRRLPTHAWPDRPGPRADVVAGRRRSAPSANPVAPVRRSDRYRRRGCADPSSAARRRIPPDQPLLPAHVDPGQHRAPGVAHLDLGLRPRQAPAHHDEPRPGLLRRFRARVDQRQHAPQLLHAAGATAGMHQRIHVFGGNAGGSCQGIDPDHRDRQPWPPPEVERRARGRGDRHAVDGGHLALRQRLVAGDDQRRRTGAITYQLSGRVGIDPLCAKQRCCGAACHDGVFPGP